MKKVVYFFAISSLFVVGYMEASQKKGREITLHLSGNDNGLQQAIEMSRVEYEDTETRKAIEASLKELEETTDNKEEEEEEKESKSSQGGLDYFLQLQAASRKKRLAATDNKTTVAIVDSGKATAPHQKNDKSRYRTGTQCNTKVKVSATRAQENKQMAQNWVALKEKKDEERKVKSLNTFFQASNDTISYTRKINPRNIRIIFDSQEHAFSEWQVDWLERINDLTIVYDKFRGSFLEFAVYCGAIAPVKQAITLGATITTNTIVQAYEDKNWNVLNLLYEMSRGVGRSFLGVQTKINFLFMQAVIFLNLDSAFRLVDMVNQDFIKALLSGENDLKDQFIENVNEKFGKGSGESILSYVENHVCIDGTPWEEQNRVQEELFYMESISNPTPLQTFIKDFMTLALRSLERHELLAKNYKLNSENAEFFQQNKKQQEVIKKIENTQQRLSELVEKQSGVVQQLNDQNTQLQQKLSSQEAASQMNLQQLQDMILLQNQQQQQQMRQFQHMILMQNQQARTQNDSTMTNFQQMMMLQNQQFQQQNQQSFQQLQTAMLLQNQQQQQQMQQFQNAIFTQNEQAQARNESNIANFQQMMILQNQQFQQQNQQSFQQLQTAMLLQNQQQMQQFQNVFLKPQRPVLNEPSQGQNTKSNETDNSDDSSEELRTRTETEGPAPAVPGTPAAVVVPNSATDFLRFDLRPLNKGTVNSTNRYGENFLMLAVKALISSYHDDYSTQEDREVNFERMKYVLELNGTPEIMSIHKESPASFCINANCFEPDIVVPLLTDAVVFNYHYGNDDDTLLHLIAKNVEAAQNMPNDVERLLTIILKNRSDMNYSPQNGKKQTPLQVARNLNNWVVVNWYRQSLPNAD